MRNSYNYLGKIELRLTPFEFDFIIKAVDKYIDDNKLDKEEVTQLQNDINKIYLYGYLKGDKDDEECY